jgi:formamidopyrimidine-DNA glycosylase
LPELPEVQTIVDALTKAGIIGRRITRATVLWPKTISASTPRKFCKLVRFKKISSIRRRAKYIIFSLADEWFIAVHLRMTGRFELLPAKVGPSPHVQIVLDLSDGRRLMFHDTRKFGRFYITRDIAAITRSLGPEPLSPKFTARLLAGKLKSRKRQIKPLLLDQSFLSGLGNIYVDEALWAARIHPRRLSDSLDGGEIKSLHRSIRRVLRQGIRNAGTSLGRGLGNYSGLAKTFGGNGAHLKVFQRTGEPCARCGHQIERIVVAQRGTHICMDCQT